MISVSNWTWEVFQEMLDPFPLMSSQVPLGTINSRTVSQLVFWGQRGNKRPVSPEHRKLRSSHCPCLCFFSCYRDRILLQIFTCIMRRTLHRWTIRVKEKRWGFPAGFDGRAVRFRVPGGNEGWVCRASACCPVRSSARYYGSGRHYITGSLGMWVSRCEPRWCDCGSAHVWCVVLQDVFPA